MKFIADAMLGSLAKWLRILGYDTLFDPALDDHRLARLARAEGRVLLTRDRELARRRGLQALLIDDQQLDAQIRQVLADLDLVADRSFSRCPVCNEALEALDRQAAASRVPPYIAETHDQFSSCPRCQRVYWRGTHWQDMDDHLARIARPDIQATTDGSGSNHNQTDGG